MCIINNIGSLNLKSSLFVLHLSYNWTLHFLRSFIHSTRAFPFSKSFNIIQIRFDDLLPRKLLSYVNNARFNEFSQ